MDKKEAGLTMKKGALFLVLFALLMLIVGCETAKGAASGAKKDYQNLKKADAQMREILW